MNSLYQFTVNKQVEVERTEDTPEGKLTKKVTEDVPVQVILKKPSRRENEEGDTIYSVELHRCMRAGMLTEPLLVKYYASEGGIFTQEEQAEYNSLFLRLGELENEFQRVSLTESADKEQKVKAATEALLATQQRLQDFKRAQQSLFNQTAEKKASDKAILWYVTHLTHVSENNQPPVPFFKGKDFDAKLSEVDAADERGDEFFLKIWQKALLFISFWYMGSAQKEEDFKRIEEQIEKKPDEAPVE